MSSFVPAPPALSAPPQRLVQPACKRPRPAPPLCVAPPPPRPRTRLPPLPSQSEETTSAPPPPICFTQTCESLRELCEARGALGRGVRATLRAFHRRASFALSTSNAWPLPRRPGLSRPDNNIDIHNDNDAADETAIAHTAGTHDYYVEIGPAYVRATAQMSVHPVSRYSVEFHAWPALQRLLHWEEVCTTTARSRRASLRRLSPGARYGRHVFVRADALSALLHVAEELVGDTAEEPCSPGAGLCGPGDDGGGAQSSDRAMAFSPLSDSLARMARGLPRRRVGFAQSAPLRVVALVQLNRRPTPGRMAVAARCPFAETRDCCRGRSLVLWMNGDGLTGGAFCPVCEGGYRNSGLHTPASMLSESSMVLALATTVGPGAVTAPASPRVTWRVHLLRNNVAALCVPLRGIRRPAHADRLAARVVARRRGAGTAQDGSEATGSARGEG